MDNKSRTRSVEARIVETNKGMFSESLEIYLLLYLIFFYPVPFIHSLFHNLSFCCLSFLFYMYIFSFDVRLFFSRRMAILVLHMVFAETVKPTFYGEPDQGRLSTSALYCLEPQC